MTHDTERTESDRSPVRREGSPTRGEWNRTGQPSVAIVETIAEATGHDPTALPPLYHSVDPEALDTLLTQGMSRKQHVQVSFTYEDVLVSVGSDGDVSVRAGGTES